MTWLNRYMCDAIEEARTCVKTLNFAIIPSLLEEIQIMGNRMESKLADLKDSEELTELISAKRKELKKIKAEIKELKGDGDDN